MPGLNKKAAVELSLSFIVIIIISLVVFAGSMMIVRKIFFGAEEIKVMLDEQTEEEIRGLLAGGEIVAVPIAQRTIQNGAQGVFWIAISNALPAQTTFNVIVGFDEGYSPEGRTVTQSLDRPTVNREWLLYNPGPYTIAPGDNTAVSVLVSPENAPKGFYAFNVCIFSEDIPLKITDGTTNCWDADNWQYLYPLDATEKGHPFRFIVEVR